MKRFLALAALSTMAMGGAIASPAAADPAGAGSASAYGATIALGGSEAIPPTPLAEISLPPGGEAAETAIDIPASPVAVSGTLNASAIAHAASDVESQLTVVTQEVEGPYNVTATALIEGLDVLLDAAGEGVSLVSAAAVRAEAAAVCRAGTIEYTANSEIIDLDVGGEDIPLNAPVTELIDAIAEVLDTTGLNAVVDVERNVVTELDGGGIAVDALVVSIAGDAIANVRIGHAEVSGASCGAAGECSDTVDNADTEDTLADAADPGCHTDGNAANPESYDPTDDDETDAPAGALPKTGGGDIALVGGSLLGALAVGLQLLRRRALA